MGAHLVEIESEEESSWLATEFLMTGLLTYILSLNCYLVLTKYRYNSFEFTFTLNS